MRHIIDPDLGKDIVSLGFIKGLEIEDGHVRFKLELTTPACPVKERFKQACEQAVGELPGVKSVTVEMGARQPRQKAGPQIDTLTGVDSIIAVSSCKGGVGKSTVAAHLARSMQREGLKVGLLDADVYGPSVPTLFNVHNPGVAISPEQHIIPIDLDGMKVMSMGFLLGESPAVLRGPIVSNYIQQVLRQTDWGKLDYLIIDLPPGTGDIQLTIVQQAALDGAIIVTTPQALSLVDVSRGILMFEKVQVPVLGVVENMCYLQCKCGEVHYPFGRSQGKLQERFGLPTLAELPITPGVSDLSQGAAGEEIAGFSKMADQVHRAVGMSRVKDKSTPKLDLQGDELVLQWPEGGESRVQAHKLRCACPCALCVDEYTGAQILDPETIPQDISIDGMDQLGNYAVAFQWSDGHTTGIYSWEYLRKL